MKAVRTTRWTPTPSLLRRVGWRSGPRRAWIRDVAPRLAAAAVPAGEGGWRTDAVTFSDTSVAVAIVSRGADGQRYVVKLPCTAEGVQSLRRQAGVLTALHGDGRLGGWRAVVPRSLGEGEVDGYRYWVEEALPGIPATAALRRGRATNLLDAAMRLIGDLHARTSACRILDEATVRAWVDGPIRRLEEFCATPPRRRVYLGALGQVRAELTEALGGRPARICWIHGDFWPGNLLASGPAVTGVVDWDRASASQLPLHDLLHLHVLSRRLATGDELGEVVVRALRESLSAEIGVPAGRLAAWLDGIPERPAVLLYWLRHVSLFIDSEGHRDNPRWLRGNIERVLARA